MPRFYYEARDRKGAVIQGNLEAADVYLARKAIANMNLIALKIQRFDPSLFRGGVQELWNRIAYKVTLEEKLILIGQLEIGFSVGVPILQVLQMVTQDTENPTLKKVLTEIIRDVSQGSTLHSAFGKHPVIFDPTVVGLIKTGEASGELEQTLSRVGKMLEQQSENKQKIKAALFYPKIVIFVMFVVMFVVVYFVMPKIKAFLLSNGSDLPTITKVVIAFSDFILGYWWAIAAGYFGGRQAFRSWVATEKGRVTWDRIKLKLPVFGLLFLHLELNNYAVVLELLVSGGVPLLEALETLKASQTNQLIKNDITLSQVEIARGGTLAAGMGKSQNFPVSFRSLIGVGEETGKLPTVLSRLGKYYQSQVDYRLNNLSKLIEPILLFFIFGAVLVLALAVFLPIWKMRPR